MTILWDWNGTLLDDTDAAVAALNAMLGRRGLPPIDMDFYRCNFAFPVRPFYEAIGIRLDREDWDALAREYHDTYNAQPVRLNAEASAAIELADSAGARQCVVSALRQDFLEAAVARFGLAGRFVAVRGTDNLDGGSKLGRVRELVDEMRDPDVVLIGDSLHDKESADAVGAGCVLFGGGSHDPARLRPMAPVGDTLTDSVRLALRLGGNAPRLGVSDEPASSSAGFLV